jgi:fimbrial chaperone protein
VRILARACSGGPSRLDRRTSERNAGGVKRLGGVILASGILLGHAGGGAAPSIVLDPTRIYLAPSARSRVVTLENLGDAEHRYRISAFAWDQDARGEMLLTPTSDIVVSPPSLTLPPNSAGTVRIEASSVTLFGPVEKPYRILIEELPLAPGSVAGAPAGVTMLMNMNLPVFVMPEAGTVAADLQVVDVSAGRVALRLRNTGTLHFHPDAIRIIGLDESGAIAFVRNVRPGYVLPGGVREFEDRLPAGACEGVSTLVVQAVIPGLARQERRVSAPGDCGS